LNPYTLAAQPYKPAKIKFLFIAEAPSAFATPEKRSHFYFGENLNPDLLFSSLMYAVLDAEYRRVNGNKAELLEEFKNRGFFLLDAVEEPINYVNNVKTDERDRTGLIAGNIPNLLARLAALKDEGCLEPATGIVLLKKLTFRVLAPALKEAGYRVLNTAEIGYPRHPYDAEMSEAIRRLILAPPA
jgi:hypothetical protein